MKVEAFAAGLLFLVCAGVPPLAAQQYSDDDLIRIGNQAWQQRNCMRTGQYLFAYLLRNPASVRDDPAYRDRLLKAIAWCEQNTAVYADVKGDGKTNAPQQPSLNLAPPASASSSSAVQRRCDIYARLAAAQSAANSANRCGQSGNRWNPGYDFHYQYCLGAPAAEIFAETQTRQNLLRACAP